MTSGEMLVAKQKKSVTDFNKDVGNKRLIFHVQSEIVKILQNKEKVSHFCNCVSCNNFEPCNSLSLLNLYDLNP